MSIRCRRIDAHACLGDACSAHARARSNPSLPMRVRVRACVLVLSGGVESVYIHDSWVPLRSPFGGYYRSRTVWQW